MKKRISIALVSILAASASLGATAYAEGEADPGYTEKELTAYYYNAEDTGTIKALFFDDLPSVPYVSAVDYINTVFLNKDYTSEESGDGVYTISGATGSFVVDTVNDTVHFDDYEKFVTLRTEREDKLPEYLGFGDFELVGELHPTDIDLSAYNIDIQSIDGELYFPLPLLSDMFAYSFCEAVYINDSVCFIDPFYGVGDSYIDYTDFVNSSERSEDMAVYAYNELCFIVDNFYGNPSRTVLHDNIEEKGLDRTLSETSEYTAELKEMLLSTDRIEYYKGLYYLDSYLYDGGHTFLTYGITTMNALYPEAVVPAEVLDYIQSTVSYPEVDPFFVTYSKSNGSQGMNECKAATFTDDIIVKEWENCFYSEYGDTGIFSFDSFSSEILQPFHESLELAKEHGIKNYVLDLSTNSGGDSGVACCIFNIILNRDYITYVSHISGNVYHDHARTDKNLDGVIDEKDDKVSYDFNFAVLASHISFSSANMIPVFAKDEGIVLLGEHTGGGSCCLFTMLYPEGGKFSCSGDLSVIDANGDDVDLGVEPDYVLYSDNEDGSRDYSDMYDFAKISADIHEYYGDTIEDNSDDSTESIADENTEIDTDESTESVADENTESVADESTESVTDESTESVTDESTESVADESTESVTDESTDPVTVSPAADTPVSSPVTGNLNISVIAAFAALSLASAIALRKRK